VFDRGKVMTEAELEDGREFARYMDVDGDGVPYRTYPGTHPSRGGYFTRGTTKNARAQYSEAGPDYIYNMERLLRKFDTAKALVPKPVLRQAAMPATDGVIYFGSTSPAMLEALELLQAKGVHLDALRVRAYPFNSDVGDFIATHARVFVVEQNRDAQLRTLVIEEFDTDPAKLVKILHYDGTPITARFIAGAIGARCGMGAASKEKVA
jgi:2-oxoglutarate ferredoxin oxidoreductase subunit alpha